MAATEALNNRHIVSRVLFQLAESKHKERQQRGPNYPVEFLEFRPTLLSSILVNKLWAEEGTSILWSRYPQLPALELMTYNRRQNYANKVERIFCVVSTHSNEDLSFLDGLNWPRLKCLELDIDWRTRGHSFRNMLHAGIESLELSGVQSGDSDYIAESVLPALFAPCKNLQKIHIGPHTVDAQDPVDAYALLTLLNAVPSIKEIRIMNTNFLGKDMLFTRLSQRPGLQALEIDLEPGLELLPYFSGPNALPSPFASLQRLKMVCYPEIALALPVHLPTLQEIQFDVARIPQQPVDFSDLNIFDDILNSLSQCPELRVLKINVGKLAIGFPAARLYPSLSGKSLVKLAASCSKLQDISISAFQPSSVNGSTISSRHFEAFCEKLPHLSSLCLNFHPTTATSLQDSALQSLGRYCPKLEVLRMGIPLQLPSLAKLDDILADDKGISSTTAVNHSKPITSTSSTLGGADLPRSKASSAKPKSHIQPLFPHVTRLTFARPKTALSAPSLVSRFKPVVDPKLEKDIVRSWAQPLLTHFPRLERLEAWGDSSGWDNYSLNYFLVMDKDEILASMWEFLSGLEQDLWLNDEEESAPMAVDTGCDIEHVNEQTGFESHGSGGDWEKASLMNEFPVNEQIAETRYMHPIHEEHEDLTMHTHPLALEDEGYCEGEGSEGNSVIVPAIMSTSIRPKQSAIRGVLKSMICTRIR
ncbi:hypothetical protein P153DRAFT_104570 [Dothidotthia symphoricarpi CBS 119687]|uniref:RNI-like protein n=1 Tax=Dothidotthia symphoricarpi CBS 119687 TaxID=1392245 RepID=A0A6A6AU80_9PLEO|nr:uncharacterized protein P153DRAFT_104570 [Dothidotthia symphoricarpi CBS 119687]KAF2134091.1 hypothetical protein P153DRAFT_104570 [Dothidotthia symphoricarpi CBS 119687]